MTALIAFGAAVLLGAGAAWGACPLPVDGHADASKRESIARGCVAADPGDSPARRALLRALAERGAFEAAIQVAEEGRRREGSASEWPLARIRLLAWNGDGAGAEAAFQDLDLALQRSPEALRLHGDLSWWSGHAHSAAHRYAGALAAAPGDREARWNRGLALRTLGEEHAAVAEFNRLCQSDPADERACRAREAPASFPPSAGLPTGETRPFGTLRLSLSPRFATSNTANEQALAGAFDLLFERRRFVGLGIELQRRAPTLGSANIDVLLNTAGGLALNDTVQLSAGASYGPGAETAPQLQLWLQGDFVARPALLLGLRTWYLQFQSAEALVVVPAITWSPTPWSLDLRDYVAWHNDGDVTHGLLLRGSRTFAGWLEPQLGIGVGQGTDYLGAPRASAGDYALLLAGLRASFTDSGSVHGAYIYRREQAAGQTFSRNEIALGWVELF